MLLSLQLWSLFIHAILPVYLSLKVVDYMGWGVGMSVHHILPLEPHTRVREGFSTLEMLLSLQLWSLFIHTTLPVYLSLKVVDYMGLGAWGVCASYFTT